MQKKFCNLNCKTTLLSFFQLCQDLTYFVRLDFAKIQTESQPVFKSVSSKSSLTCLLYLLSSAFPLLMILELEPRFEDKDSESFFLGRDDQSKQPPWNDPQRAQLGVAGIIFHAAYLYKTASRTHIKQKAKRNKEP